MKIIKYLLLSSLVIILSISAWIYYPQYQIYKLKEESTTDVKTINKITYIDYYRGTDAKTINHLALGDSIIRGYHIPEEDNFVSQFTLQLEKQTEKQIATNNEGIIGITSEKLNEMVQAGIFDEQIKEADIITLNVGGNDVLKTVKKSDLYSALSSFDGLLSGFSENLASITSRISELNSTATIVFLELYNPMPADHQFYSLADKLLPKWNIKIYEIAKKNPSSVVVQTTKVINSENLHNLASDGVHPSTSGNTAISEQILEQFSSQYKPDAIYANRQN